jgi:hypothetical protein
MTTATSLIAMSIPPDRQFYAEAGYHTRLAVSQCPS